MKRFLWLIAAMIFCAAAPIGEIQPNDAVIVKLKTNELVLGVVQNKDDMKLILRSETLGIVEIPYFQIDTIEKQLSNVKAKAEIEKIPPKKIWSGYLEGGLTGSHGNVNNLSFRAAGAIARNTDANRSKAEATYNLDYKEDTDTHRQKKSGNRLNIDARSEWPLPFLPRLNYYIAGNFYYDEFKDFDYQAGGNTGFGFDLLKRERPALLLTTHAGAGVTKKFGADDPKVGEVTPEAVAGLALDWEPFSLQKVSASTEIFPNLRQLGEYRWVNKAALIFYLTQAKNLNVSLGAQHRYDTQHDVKTKSTDIDYFASVGWKF